MGAPVIMGAAMGAGALINTIGQDKASKAQASAERENASFFQEQGEFANFVKERNLENFQENFKKIVGQQRGIFAKAGIKLSGTAQRIQEVTKRRADKQIEDITKEGDFNVRLAMLRAQRSEKMASDIDSARPWQMAGGILGAGGRVAGAFI